MYEERSLVGANLESTLREKDAVIREMKTEVMQIRVDGERAFRQREEELLSQIQEKSAKEFSLTAEADRL